MKLFIAFLIIVILFGCEENTNLSNQNLEVGIWKLKNHRKRGDLGFKIDTLSIGDSLIIDRLIFPKYVIDSVIDKGEYKYLEKCTFEKNVISELKWNNKLLKVIEILIINNSDSYSLAFIYTEGIGVVLKDYSHLKAFLHKKIQNGDTLNVKPLLELISADSILNPPLNLEGIER